MKELQKLVGDMVAARGYREGWTPEQFAARQVCKAVEELGELAQAVGWLYHTPMWVDALTDAAQEARMEFDRNSNWYQVAGIDNTIAAEELADVAIPLLVMADARGIDLEAAIRAKVTGDVARGVRSAEQKAHDWQDAMAMAALAASEPVWVPLADLRPGAIFETLDGRRGVKGVKVYRGQPHCTDLRDGTGEYKGSQTLVREIVV